MKHRVTFSDIHRFSINPCNNLHLIKDMRLEDKRGREDKLIIIFIDGMELDYNCTFMEKEELFNTFKNK